MISNEPNILPNKMYIVYINNKSDDDNNKYISVYSNINDALLACNILRNKKDKPAILTVPVNLPVEAIIGQQIRK
jgi:hypothetical protein